MRQEGKTQLHWLLWIERYKSVGPLNIPSVTHITRHATRKSMLSPLAGRASQITRPGAVTLELVD